MYIYIYNKRRVGKPRLSWVSENCKWIYKKQFHEDYDQNTSNPEHVQKLTKEAKNSKFRPICINIFGPLDHPDEVEGTIPVMPIRQNF